MLPEALVGLLEVERPPRCRVPPNARFRRILTVPARSGGGRLLYRGRCQVPVDDFMLSPCCALADDAARGSRFSSRSASGHLMMGLCAKIGLFQSSRSVFVQASISARKPIAGGSNHALSRKRRCQQGTDIEDRP